MMIQVTSSGKHDAFRFVEMQMEKHSAYVSTSGDRVTVLCQNAANRAWRGMGKSFDSFEAAIAAYKSSAMKTMIEHAKELLA